MSHHQAKLKELLFFQFLSYSFSSIAISLVKPTTPAGRRDGGPTPWPATDPGDQHPYKNLSDTSPFHSPRQELPEDLPTQTPTTEYEQQWTPNTIQTVILTCNAKGIPQCNSSKNCKTKTEKTVVLEVYARWWPIRAETCSVLILYVILKLLLCRRKVYCDLQ